MKNLKYFLFIILISCQTNQSKDNVNSNVMDTTTLDSLSNRNILDTLKYKTSNNESKFKVIKKVISDDLGVYYFNTPDESYIEGHFNAFKVIEVIQDSSIWYKIKYYDNEIEKIAFIKKEDIIELDQLNFNKSNLNYILGEYVDYRKYISYEDSSIEFKPIRVNLDHENIYNKALLSYDLKYNRDTINNTNTKSGVELDCKNGRIIIQNLILVDETESERYRYYGTLKELNWHCVEVLTWENYYVDVYDINTGKRIFRTNSIPIVHPNKNTFISITQDPYIMSSDLEYWTIQNNQWKRKYKVDYNTWISTKEINSFVWYENELYFKATPCLRFFAEPNNQDIYNQILKITIKNEN